MNLILKIISTLIFLSQCIKSQQNYSGTAGFDCKTKSSDEAKPSESFLYKCNGNYSFCRAFLIFTAKSPYNTLVAIAALTSSDQTEISRVNNATMFTIFQEGQEVIVPVNCSCSDEHYKAITTYQITTEFETYFSIANKTYQGLSTCYSLLHTNTYHESSFIPGHKLRVPLKCACPTRKQAAVGTKFLLSYSVGKGDTLYALSKRFNVSVMSISEANSLSSDESSTIYPFTTILIPLPSEPSRSYTVSRDYNQATTPLPSTEPHHVLKSPSNRVLLSVGIALGAFSLLILLLVIIFLFHKKRTRILHSRGRNTNASSAQDLILEIAKLDRALKEFKFSEIKKATGNFGSKRRINGCVYRGTFKRENLAVKKCSNEVDNEMKMLYKINHFNIVKLHGFCEHRDDLYLAYEYMANGSLHEWLSRKGVKRWNQRICIALDVANGLLYLHSFANPAYVHNDVTSSNILLDGNLRAKIAHFSLARIAKCNTTPKVDIFAFGVVLLELITDKYSVFKQEEKEILLSKTIAAIMESQNADAELSLFIGPDLTENGGIKYAIQMAKLSLSCFREVPEDRPDMVEVVSILMKMQSSIHTRKITTCGD